MSGRMFLSPPPHSPSSPLIHKKGTELINLSSFKIGGEAGRGALVVDEDASVVVAQVRVLLHAQKADFQQFHERNVFVMADRALVGDVGVDVETGRDHLVSERR